MNRPREEFTYVSVDVTHKEIIERIENLELTGGDGSVKKHNEDTSAHPDIRNSLHEHVNKNTIDELSEEDGKLLFRGNEIVTSGGADASYISAGQVIETPSRNFVTKQQKDSLSGLTDNVQGKLNELTRNTKNSMIFKGVVSKYSEVTSIADPKDGWTVFVELDETNENAKSIYVYQTDKWIRVRSDKPSQGWIAQATAPTNTKVLWVDIADPAQIVIKWHNGISWLKVAGGGGGGANLPISANDVTEETNKRFVNKQMYDILGNMSEDPVTSSLMYRGKLLAGGSSASIDDATASTSTTYSSTKLEKLLEGKQAKLSYAPENPANKNKASGYVGLNSLAKIEESVLPENALFKTHVVESSVERLALTGIKNGEQCYEKGSSKYYLYDGSKWIYLSDAVKTLNSAYNNLTASKSPIETDDETSGYSTGSIWINTTTKESFICTDAAAGAAKWDLMGGQVNLNVSEIIPFTYDEKSPDRIPMQTKFYLPEHKRNESYLELSKNGVELIEGTDYTILLDEEKQQYYIKLVEGVDVTEVIHGEIYQADVDNVYEYMTCSKYDSNHDGKVDRAEVADSVATLRQWEAMTSYKENDLILKDGIIYRANSNFGSGIEFDTTKWEKVKAAAADLDNLNTSDLVDSLDRRYVTDLQLVDIKSIPDFKKEVATLSKTVENGDTKLQTQITNIQNLLPAGVSSSNKLVESNTLSNMISNIRLKGLFDTPSEYVKDGFIKVKADGTGIEYLANPRFPIMSVTDKKGVSTTDVYDLKLNGFEYSAFDGSQLTLSPKIKSSELEDMPLIDEHGCVLVSDLTHMRYDLVNIEDLTISQENFVQEINAVDWTQTVIDGETYYEYVISHTLNSEALIISCFNDNKESIFLHHQIIDDRQVKIVSRTDEYVKVVINCSLGVTNGYWKHIFDLSRVSEIDDKVIKINRTYSSQKLEDLLKNKMDKSLAYTKQESTNLFASKALEHAHTNLSVLEKFKEDIQGEVLYNGKKLLTSIKGKTIEISKTFNGESVEIVDMPTLVIQNSISTVLGTELVIQNTSEAVIHLTIKDGDIILINEEMPVGGVQKYNLGISSKTNIVVSGQGKFNFYISTI